MRLARVLRYFGVGFGLSILLWLGSARGPVLSAQLVQIHPPAAYAEWWASAERCVGRQRLMATVDFYVVQGPYFELFVADGVLDDVIGFYDVVHDRVYVSQAYMFDRLVVEHEMVHALGVVGHPVRYFEQCGL